MRRNAFLILVACALVAAGCANDGATKPPTAPPPRVSADPLPAGAAMSNTDPSAQRLHDLCGALLLFYFEQQRLPESLEELKSSPGDSEAVSFVSPVTNTPYLYTAGGILIPERDARIVIYDPSPNRANVRWAVMIDDPVPGKALVTKVLPLPESFFLVRPPK